MAHKHDFKAFPELTNNQIQFYYWDSPHKQILEDFRAKVARVIDGDTIRVLWNERDFDFPVRLLNIAAAEINEPGGVRSRERLKSLIDNEEIDITIDINNRVGRWGRLLGTIYHSGLNINEQMIREGFAVAWQDRKGHTIPDFKQELEQHAIEL